MAIIEARKSGLVLIFKEDMILAYSLFNTQYSQITLQDIKPTTHLCKMLA